MTRTAPLAALSALFAAGCATQAPPAAVDPARVAAYESPASAPAKYDIVQRLWVESWRTAFGSQTYASPQDGLADLRARAGALGGNGVLNAGCSTLPGWRGNGTAVACNGTVIRAP